VNKRGIPALTKFGWWNRYGGYCGGRGRRERGRKTWAEEAQEGAKQQIILDNASACEAATISNKTKLLKSTDQEQSRSVALLLESTTTAHDSRTAMYRLVWSFSLVPGVEYLAVENGLRVEDLLRTKLVLRVCNKVLSQFTHRCCYEADETKGEWLHTQWDPDQTWVQVHVAYLQ
jgi:hypothetical protein